MELCKKQLVPQPQVIVGSWNPNLLLKIFPLWAIAVVYINIYLATVKGETGPFPHASISECSDYYPQNFYFRLSYLPQAIFYCVVDYVFYKYVNTLAQLHNYPKVKKYILYMGYLAQVLLSIAAATVEQNGKEDDPIHSTTAAICFVVQCFFMIGITTGMYRMWKYNPEYASLASIIVKVVIIVLIIIIAIVEVINEAIQHFRTPK